MVDWILNLLDAISYTSTREKIVLLGIFIPLVLGAILATIIRDEEIFDIFLLFAVTVSFVIVLLIAVLFPREMKGKPAVVIRHTIATKKPTGEKPKPEPSPNLDIIPDQDQDQDQGPKVLPDEHPGRIMLDRKKIKFTNSRLATIKSTPLNQLLHSLKNKWQTHH